jgi:hypothetical protein
MLITPFVLFRPKAPKKGIFVSLKTRLKTGFKNHANLPGNSGEILTETNFYA